MNYIGSKQKLSSFISTTVNSIVGSDISQKTFCDLFAGTGVVGRSFKKDVKKVISNDLEYYSFVLNKNYIENHEPFDYYALIEELNALHGVEGFVFNEYSENGTSKRLYYSENNGKKIDAIRQKIEYWKTSNQINSNVYYFLLASLLESADKVANTASVYGAYLKHTKKSAKKELILEPALFEINANKHEVFNEDSNALIQKIEGDILYLDPPYNARQYGANYHILNTIAKYDSFIPRGKTGLREYNRSDYCSKSQVKKSFEDLIKNASFRYTFLSYNNEGLMSAEEIRNIMSKYGQYDLATTNYQRFKADKTENRNHIANSTTEFLHILEKS
jgi:adenine-specific DNA-methyltransferase